MKPIIACFVLMFTYSAVWNHCGTQSMSVEPMSSVDPLLDFNETTAFVNPSHLNTPMPAYAASLIGFSNNKMGSSSSDDKNQTMKRNRKLVTLLASINYEGVTPAGPICTKAMEVALDQLRKQPNFLPDYELAIQLIDDERDDALAINKLIDELEKNADTENRLPILLGIGCPAMAQRIDARLMVPYNFLSLAILQNSPELFLARKRYSSFFSLGDQADITQTALVDFVAKLGWQRMAVMSEIFAVYDAVEKSFIPLIERKNLTLAWMGKVTYQSNDVEEMSKAFAEMKSHDPRIILLEVDSAVSMACWLHRYGMFGPNYVTFFFYWSPLDPGQPIPDYIAEWCTPTMISDVMKSSFFLGDSTMMDTYGYDFKDSTGINGFEFDDALRNKLVDAEQSPYWGYYRTLCYDLVLFAGHWLNTTESHLKTKNQTLSDLFTNTKNFQKRGDQVVKLLKKTLWDTEMTGFKGVYQFEETTLYNSRGYTPTTFSQLQETNNGNSTELKMVAIYKQNDLIPLAIDNAAIVWYTSNGMPPADHANIVTVEQALVPKVASSILIAFGIVGILACCSISVKICKKAKPVKRDGSLHVDSFNEFKLMDLMVLIGTAVLLCQVFALPIGAHSSVATYCTAFSALLFLGYSTSIFGLMVKAEGSRRRLLVRNELIEINVVAPSDVTAKWSPKRRAKLRHLKTRKLFAAKFTMKWLVVVLFVWLAVNAVLLVTFLQVAAFKVVAVNTALVPSLTETSTVYQFYRYECKSDLDGSVGGFATVSLAAILHTFVLLYAGFAAYSIRSASANSWVKAISTCVYCIVLVLLGGAFVAVLVSQSILIVLPCVTIFYTTIIIGFTIFEKGFLIKGQTHDQGNNGQHARQSVWDSQNNNKNKNCIITNDDCQRSSIGRLADDGNYNTDISLGSSTITHNLSSIIRDVRPVGRKSRPSIVTITAQVMAEDYNRKSQTAGGVTHAT